MENEVFDIQNTEENIDNTESGSEIIESVPTSKYEDTDLYNSQKVTRDILSALEEEGYITKSGVEEETVDEDTHGEYYDLLIQMNSHLEYIEEHLYETPSGHDINTPLNEYGLSEILLVGVLIVLGISFVFNVIKDNVIHIR